MDDDGEFTSLIDRERKKNPRIHTELTQVSRDRLASITKFVRDKDKNWAFNELEKKLGASGLAQYIEEDISLIFPIGKHLEFIHKADTILVLSYVEYLINRAYDKAERYGIGYTYDDVNEAIDQIEDVLLTEGLLWEVERMDDGIQFNRLADKTVAEADEELRVLALGERWREPLAGYNEAWELYKDGTFTYVIPEKLYNSVEAVLEKICAELNDWESENVGVGTYLDAMHKRDFFEANPEMYPAWKKIFEGLKIAVQKAGSDRKRHENLDKHYCILLIHEISAALTFLIKKYENEYS